MAVFDKSPKSTQYDVVIVGGAMMGSSTAWFLSSNPDFNGSILVVERDASYENSSTAHTNSCVRQQFSTPLNVKISQFTASFIKDLPNQINDARAPALGIQNYGYMYLADNETFAENLKSSQAIQLAQGAETEILDAAEIAKRYPFYNVDDIVLGSINRKDEGYWDGGLLFEWWRRKAIDQGVEYVENEVTAISSDGGKVTSVTLADGTKVNCGYVVNASGPRGSQTAKMAGIDLPVEPRKRFTWIFTAEQPLDQDLPLTIDPSGVHMRQDGPKSYLAGSPPDMDPAVDYNDFSMDHSLWETKVWPAIASRVPQFEAIKVVTEWAGHYAYNRFDQNAVLGEDPKLKNFIFLNGFSGHGLQQSPAMGRATAEWITYGEYRELDMSPFSYERIIKGEPFIEKAVI